MIFLLFTQILCNKIDKFEKCMIKIKIIILFELVKYIWFNFFYIIICNLKFSQIQPTYSVLNTSWYSLWEKFRFHNGDIKNCWYQTYRTHTSNILNLYYYYLFCYYVWRDTYVQKIIYFTVIFQKLTEFNSLE